jgi:hypothetical protein
MGCTKEFRHLNKMDVMNDTYPSAPPRTQRSTSPSPNWCGRHHSCCDGHDKKCYATKHKLRSEFEKGSLVKFCESSYSQFKGKVGVLLSYVERPGFELHESIGGRGNSWWEVLVEGELYNFYAMYMRDAQ